MNFKDYIQTNRMMDLVEGWEVGYSPPKELNLFLLIDDFLRQTCIQLTTNVFLVI